MAALVASITRLNIALVRTDPPGLAILVEGEVAGRGWRGFALDHPIYIALPPDGVYEADMTAVPPAGRARRAAIAFSHHELWSPVPADLTGLRVRAATNEMVAMLD